VEVAVDRELKKIKDRGQGEWQEFSHAGIQLEEFPRPSSCSDE